MSVRAYKGQDLLLNIDNELADVTHMDSDGFQTVRVDAGVQLMEITLEGLFKDDGVGDMIRESALNRTTKNYRLSFPNGNTYTAPFVVKNYQRRADFDGLEGFSLSLVRSGEGTFSYS